MLLKTSKFLVELSRRRVIRAVGIYGAALWLLSQGVADLFPAFGLPDWSVRAFVIVGLLGIPVVIAVAWVYDITPEGLVRDDQATLTDQAFSGSVTVRWRDAQGMARQRRFSRELTAGRDVGTDIQLADKRVSRRHCRLFAESGYWFAEDLGSSNGTFLDGERIERSRLPSTCRLRLHPEGPELDIQVRLPDPDETLAS